jgi:hypothetical protein
MGTTNRRVSPLGRVLVTIDGLLIAFAAVEGVNVGDPPPAVASLTPVAIAALEVAELVAISRR